MRLIRRKKSEKLSDKELVESIRNGNLSNIDELYKRCRTYIIHHVLNNYGNEQEAEDILQDTVIDLYEKIMSGSYQLNENNKITSYTGKVARYMWSNKRRKKRQLVRFDDEDMLEAEEENEWQIEEERFDQLKVTIEKLDEVCREILRQRYWLKKKFDEITVANFMTVDALKMRSSRCHRQLKTMYG